MGVTSAWLRRCQRAGFFCAFLASTAFVLVTAATSEHGVFRAVAHILACVCCAEAAYYLLDLLVPRLTMRGSRRLHMLWLLSFTCVIFWYSLGAAESAGLEPLFVLRKDADGKIMNVGQETFGRSVGLVVATALAPLFLGLFLKALFEEQFLSIYDRCDDNLTKVSNVDVVQLVTGGAPGASLLSVAGTAAKMRFQPSKQKASALLALTLGIRFMLTMLSHMGLANADVEYMAQVHAEFVSKIKEARANEARRRQLQLTGSSRKMRLARRRKVNARIKNGIRSEGRTSRSERRLVRRRRGASSRRRRGSGKRRKSRNAGYISEEDDPEVQAVAAFFPDVTKVGRHERSTSVSRREAGKTGDASSSTNFSRRRGRRHQYKSSIDLVSSPGSGDGFQIAPEDDGLSSSSNSDFSQSSLEWSEDSDNAYPAPDEVGDDDDNEYDFIDDTDILYDEDDENAVEDAHVSEMTEACVVFLAQLSSIAFAKLRAHAETGIPHAVAGLLRNRQVMGGFSSWLAGKLDRVDSTLLPLPDPLEPSGGVTHFCLSSLMVLFVTRYFVTPFSLGMFGRSGVTVSRRARSGVLTYMLVRLVVNWLREHTEKQTKRLRKALRTPAYRAKIGTDSGEAETTPRSVLSWGSTPYRWFSGWQGDGHDASQAPAGPADQIRFRSRSGRRRTSTPGYSPRTPPVPYRKQAKSGPSSRMSWMSPHFSA